MDMERQGVIAASGDAGEASDAVVLAETDAPVRKASFLSSMKAVAWSFIGLRRRQHYEADAATLSPVHVVIAALLCAAIFVGVLIMAVRYAVSG